MLFKKMDWVKWSAISEILSSISILVTLIFLTMQFGQSTKATFAETRTAIWQINQMTSASLIQVPRIAVSMRKPELLTLEEKTELFSWLVSFYGVREFVWLQYKDGVVDESTFTTYLDGVENQLVLPRVYSWWQKFGNNMFDPKFVEFVNAQYNKIAANPVRDKMEEWL